MLRTVLFLLLLLIAAVPAQAQTFSLEPLVEEHKQHIAPPNIQVSMRKGEKIDFDDCIKDINLSPTDQTTYFSSLPIKLGSKETRHHLVFPSAYCKAFFGAHAIAYWILREESPSEFTVLYRGRSDGFEVLQTKTKEFSDLKSVYGFTFIVLQYNGKEYVRTSSGEQR